MQATGTTPPPTTGQKAYVYTYDDLSRLTNASFKEIASGNWQQTSKFNENIKGYDLNGNITGIIRRGSHSNWNTGLIDVLSYHYYGNQLIAVDDSIKTDHGYDFFDNNHSFNGAYREYEFDANGNITRDVNKGIIELTYNHLNLPRKISFSKLDFLEYLYDASGNKLRQVEYKQSNINKTTDFISNFVIVNNAPACINFDEGRVIMDGTNVHFTETHLKDHLGNTRVVFGYKNNALLVKQVSSYYPFGMNIKGLTTQVTIEDAKHPANEYLYNGKMFQDELGLDWLDYGARMYDAVLGRFHAQDRFAEKYIDLTLYQYGANNPILFIDVNGDSISVSEQNRKQFQSSLESVFGKNASKFSYSSTGKLLYNGTKKDFRGDEKKAFKGLSKVMNEEMNTNVVYGSSAQITMNDGTIVTVDASQGGGALAVLACENNVSENTILVDPNASSTFTVQAVNSTYYENGGKAVPGATTASTVNFSFQNATWHELGHIIYAGKRQDKVLDFDNMTRRLNKSTNIVPSSAPGYDKGASGYTRKIFKNSPMKPRPYDVTHNSLIR